MFPTRLSRVLVLCAAVCTAAARAEDLPDAPNPPVQDNTHVTVPATRPPTAAAVAKRHWSDVVEPGEKVPALTKRDKLLFPVHETFRWSTPSAVLFSGWYGILTDNNPHFGVDAPGFGERVGAAAARQESSRFFSDGFLPILLHEDPRYYRKAYGSYPKRTLYSVSRILVTQRDNGSTGFNYSKVLGRGISASLTQTYYPQSSIAPNVVFKAWGVSLMQLAGANFFDEFWPDVKQALFHKAN